MVNRSLYVFSFTAAPIFTAGLAYTMFMLAAVYFSILPFFFFFLFFFFGKFSKYSNIHNDIYIVYLHMHIIIIISFIDN